jgi:hypothetical protein
VKFNLKIQSILVVLILFSLPVNAGVFELAASANYRRQQINDLNYQSSESITGSISYYFMEMSAIELSYTRGTSTLRAQPISSDPWLEYINEFTIYGADLVLTFAQQTSIFQPFAKIGVAHIVKDLIIKSPVEAKRRTPSEPETVPSVGLGFKFRLTKTFSIKVGADAWITDQREDNSQFDYAGRAGVSWLL